MPRRKIHSLIVLSCALLITLASCGGPPKNEYLPPPDEFVPMETFPEHIECKEPPYPDDAYDQHITGNVWVKALVDKKGRVRDAMVGKSSGNASLDSAAVKAAFNCKYKPGLQNGKPVAAWITYNVEFSMP